MLCVCATFNIVATHKFFVKTYQEDYEIFIHDTEE